MPIKDYGNDVKMLALGRKTAKDRRIRELQEMMRDFATGIQYADNAETIKGIVNGFIEAGEELAELLDVSTANA